ncbi:PREDICTED: arrestin domain-containing protein 3-like [Cyprinodon variegatus]|uniref:arrestin domain-containing protein 3-like n=1 Tax=Cyprinodon variegatus TaxID=28743 RepID=UPI0007427559|nr:PREDICTED: arrestin domain-containing protein 3-like [Cyprinodon variegatus]
MSSTIKKIGITYNSINASNTFTNGDVVSGQVEVELAKDCQIESFYIKFKGKAEVLWSETYGQSTQVYHSKEKYFTLRHYFIKSKNSTDDQQTLITNESGATSLLSSTPPSLSLFKMELVPQHESKDKKMGLFKSGSIAMDVNLEKSGFHQGEGLKVSALIKNDSSREVKPKYCIYKKHSFFARGKRRVHTKDLIKEVGATIPPSASEKVTQVIPIPQDMEPSILNCNNIKVEHRLRVYLDVKYASDPEVKFNIFILQAPRVSAMATAPPAASDFGNGLFENYGNPNPPVWDFGPPQPPAVFLPADPPPSYGTYGMYPPLNDFANKY